MPTKIALPDHVTLDETKKDHNSIKDQHQSILVDRIFCSNRHSGILLSNGEFWAAGDSSVKIPPIERDEEFNSIVEAQALATQIAASESSEEEWGGGRNKGKNKKGKDKKGAAGAKGGKRGKKGKE